MTRIQYTGSNYDELKAILGDRLLAPYFCMGLTMLSILTDDGPITEAQQGGHRNGIGLAVHSGGD